MKTILATAAACLLVLACSGVGTFKGQGGLETGNKNPNGAGGETDITKGSTDGSDSSPGGEFAQRGKSLDLYVIVDTSASLRTYSDPDCKRLTSLASFMTGLRDKLGPDGDVRLTLVTFSISAKLIGTDQEALQTVGSDFEARYETEICSARDGTNPKAGIELTLATSAPLIAADPKQMSSVLFFSDGAPTLRGEFPPMSEIRASVSKLQGTFPNRIFGAFLEVPGIPQPPQCSDTECPPSTLEFMKIVTGSADRIRSADSADKLADALLSILK